MGIELPEHLRTGPLAEAAAKALQDAASMAASSNSVPRISLRGREFRMIENGEEVSKTREDLDVVILGVEPEAGRMIKTWYKDGYKSGAKEPPTCSSDDGIAPAPWVTDKQSATCQSCPKNAFGSATSPNGKATKACRDSKRIWLKLAKSDTPFKERTMYGLNVTVASLKSFSDHGHMLTSLGQGPAVAITRLKMLDKEYPQLEFELVGWLDAETAPESLRIAESRPWKIQYAHAGLALAAPDSSAPKTQLPMSVPAHLQTGQVVDAVAAPAKPADLDNQIAKW